MAGKCLGPTMNSASLLSLCLLLPLGLAQRGQGQDGNPHNWDRRRRCDQTEYEPPCGVCEGVGGIAFGDDNQDITLTPCAPVRTSLTTPSDQTGAVHRQPLQRDHHCSLALDSAMVDH